MIRRSRWFRPIRPATIVNRPLQLNVFEDRIVPATTTFRQGDNSYADAAQIRIDSNSPATNLNGAAVNVGLPTEGFYFLDGNASGDTGSPNQWDLLRFDKLFVSQGGPVPDGAIIRSATLKIRTGSAADSGNSQTNGPFSVAQLLVPFDANTTWGSLGLNAYNLEAPRAGTVIGSHMNAAVATFGASLTAGSYNPQQNELALADITSVVQNWSNNPSSNLGLVLRNQNTTDGWGIRTIGHPTVNDRPQLEIVWDPAPTSQSTLSFQPGVNGYTDTVSVRLLSTGTTTDANTFTGTSTVVSKNTGAGADTQMLLRYNNIFGMGANQIPAGSVINSAKLTFFTPGVTDDSSANGKGTWVLSQSLKNWTTATTYTDSLWGSNGPNYTGSYSNITPAIDGTAASSELAPLSFQRAIAWDSQVNFDVTAALAAWSTDPASNFGFNLQGGTATAADTLGLYFTGANATSLRPKLTVSYTTPALAGTNTADVVNNEFHYNGGAGLANTVNVSTNAGIYTLTDSSGPITLTPAAVTAGWTQLDANTVTGPNLPIIIGTGDGVDTITISSGISRLTVDAGGQAGDVVALTGTVDSNNTPIAIVGAGSITNAGALLKAGSSTVSLSSAAIGTSTDPVQTQAARIIVTGAGFINEADGADVVGESTGTLNITNTTGTLRIPTNETLKNTAGLTLSSNDAVTIDGFIGGTGIAALTIAANADGTGTQGFTIGTRGLVSAMGNVTVTVNTASGGTGAATLGNTGVGGTLAVNSFGGNILWNTNVTSDPSESIDYVTGSLSAVKYDFTTTGAATSIGTLARPLPLWTIQPNPTAGSSSGSFQTGSGGLFILDRGPTDFTITKATAKGAGEVRLTSGSAGGSDLYIDGPVSTGSGAIILRADDTLSLFGNALIGGPGFSGTVSLTVNLDNGNEQRLDMAASAAIVTSNSSATAVTLFVSPTDTDTTATDVGGIGGITLANITVGSGGTISATVDAAASRSGNIQQQPNTLLDATNVILSARALLQADGITPAPGSGIGTAANPIRTKASLVTVTGTNQSVFVSNTGSVNFNATVLGRTVPAGAPTPVPAAALSLTAIDGLLTLSTAAQTDGGSITLISGGTGGGILINAPLGDADTGDLTLNAGTNSITFNTNLTVNATRMATFTAGTPVNMPQTTTNNGTITAANGLEIGAAETLTGPGSVVGPVSVLGTGKLAPAGSLTSIVNTGNLSLASNAVLELNLNGATPGTDYDQLNVSGTVSIDLSSLRLNVGNVSLDQEFTIVANDGNDAVTGQFVGGTTIRGFNNPLVTFTLNYAGGDGNDIVAKVTAISSAAALLDVQGNQVIYSSNVGIANSIAVTQSATNFTLVEGASGAKISLTQAAKDAGWSGDNTNTVTGPKTGVAGLNFVTGDGNDTVTGIDAGAAGVSFSGAGTLAITGAITSTGAFALDEYTALSLTGPVSAGSATFSGLNALDLSGTGTLTASTGSIASTRLGSLTVGGVTLAAANGTITLTGTNSTTTTLNAFTANTPMLTINGAGTTSVNGIVAATGVIAVSGTTIASTATGRLDGTTVTLNGGTVGVDGAPILTKATVIVANGVNGVNVTEADGASVTATSTAANNVTVTNLLGTLTLVGTTTTGSGLITINSADAIVLDGNIGSFSGRVAINANTDGAGSEGFTHTVGRTITTTSTATDAYTITVNTASGGTGSAVLGVSTVGGNAGGTITVNANKGSILWNPGYGTVSGGTLNNPDGGGSLQATSLRARYYSFTTASDGGSIGTVDTPIQVANFAATDGQFGNSTATLSAGTGGIFLTDWSEPDLTISGATAAGGNIQLFSGNQSGHNLFIGGTIFTGSGNIWIAADDDLRIDTSAIIGGPSFAGTILLEGNRDDGNEQTISMGSAASVETTNTGPNAITFNVYATDNDSSNATLGGVLLAAVKTGSGGTVTINASANASSQGTVRQIIGSRVDTGEGTVIINARNLLNGSNPAVGAIVQYDADGSGSNVGPVQIRAKSVVVNTVNTSVWLAEGLTGFFDDSNGFELTANQSGPGFLNVVSVKGAITVAGATNNDGGSITLTASGTSGGITVNAPFADADTGNITLDAGVNAIVFNTAFTSPVNKTVTLTAGTPTAFNAGLTASGGSTIAGAVTLPAAATLAGSGTINGTVALATNSTVSPGIASIGSLATGAISISGNYAIDLTGTATGKFDAIVASDVNINGLTPIISLNGNFNVGDSVKIIDNTGSNPVSGSFAGGPNYFAINDPRYVFTISKTGGDGNDVVLTVSQVLGTILDVTPAGQVQFSSATGVVNNLSVDLVSGIYSVNDTATTILLTANAVNAGWGGSGTNTVSGPAGTVTNLLFNLTDGNDIITTLTTNASTTLLAQTHIQLFGAVTVAGDLSITTPSLDVQNSTLAMGNVTVTGATGIHSTATGLLGGNVVTLTASNAIGTATTPFRTQAKTLTLSSGDNGVFIVETDGATVSATATNAGVISIANSLGTLAATNIQTATGSISLSSADGLEVNGPIGSVGFAGTIALAANTDGAGSDGYTQSIAGNLVTTNSTPGAVTIAVNTSGGGTGDAILGTATIGGVSGGGITVNAFTGDIAWADGFVFPATAPDGGSNANVISARDFTFTGVSIGTATRPIQINSFGATDGLAGENSLILNAGSGGAYAWEWGAMDLTLAGATATGSGNITVVAANAGGNNLWVTGNVKTDTGAITLQANDNLDLTATGSIGGAGFSGTVFLSGNRDKGTAGQTLTMDPASSIITSNASANAVLIDLYGDAGTPSVITLSNVTTGSGGTITVNATPENEAGRIAIQPGTKLDTGTGKVVLITGRTTGSGNNVGTATDPLNVVAATIISTTLSGNVHIVEADGADITLTNASATGTANVTATTGALTVAEASFGGAINLTAATINVNAAVGDANTGAITFNGTAVGSSPITLGTGNVTFNQNADSTFTGLISGSKGVVKQGTGTLTLSANSTFAGNLTASGGRVVVAGTLVSGASVAAGATLASTGTASLGGAVANNGTLAPGGTLATGSLTGSGTYELDTSDVINVAGTINLAGSTLTVNPTTPIAIGTSFKVIDNDATDAIGGTFTGLAEGGVITSGSNAFAVSYIGGDGNDVTLTRVANPTVTTFSINNGDSQRSRVTTMTITFDSPVLAASYAGAGAIKLVRISGVPLTVQTGGTGGDGIISVAQGTANSLVLTFSSVEFGSLPDGRYRLDVGAFSSNPLTQPIYRLFGDWNGDATVDGGSDFSNFSIGNLTSVNAPFDFNGDGTIDGGTDFAEFGTRFGRTI